MDPEGDVVLVRVLLLYQSGKHHLLRQRRSTAALLCDANLIPNAMNTWLAKWKAKDWRKSDGKLVENRDLWERQERAAEGRNVTWAWVRGHNGTEHNERADRLAYAASRKAEKIVMGR